jgi:S-adenosyl-L-methionine hydrolase (adenosine-forming)
VNQTPAIITLTTDFGYKDPFISEMKGVILSINPYASIVDVTHDIEPFNILEAGFVIGSSYRYFPSGTIHVVVVDPGVGSKRRPLVIEISRHKFVGPDNGVFARILQEVRSAECVEISNDKYVIRKESPTFQGRDVFAPAAAWLSRGVRLSEFGPKLTAPKTISITRPQVTENELTGEVVYIDRFGNAMTNITEKDLAPIGRDYRVEIKGHSVSPVKYYAQVASSGLHCLVNSSGYLELFSYRDNASRLFGIMKGDVVFVSSQID